MAALEKKRKAADGGERSNKKSRSGTLLSFFSIKPKTTAATPNDKNGGAATKSTPALERQEMPVGKAITMDLDDTLSTPTATKLQHHERVPNRQRVLDSDDDGDDGNNEATLLSTSKNAVRADSDDELGNAAQEQPTAPLTQKLRQGLCCGARLAATVHQVTVFERGERYFRLFGIEKVKILNFGAQFVRVHGA